MMKKLLQLGLFGVLLIVSCNETELPIKNAIYKNFSDLNYISYPEIKLFENHTHFPILTTTSTDHRDYNSVLHLTESVSKIPIERENLQRLIPTSEFEELIKDHCESRIDSFICSKEYFAYGRIVKENYVLLEFGIREYGNWGRHYMFEIRTYEPNGKQISKLDFAKWSDKDKEFFEGKLTSEMDIDISSDKKVIGRYRINKVGKIEKR